MEETVSIVAGINQFVGCASYLDSTGDYIEEVDASSAKVIVDWQNDPISLSIAVRGYSPGEMDHDGIDAQAWLSVDQAIQVRDTLTRAIRAMRRNG